MAPDAGAEDGEPDEKCAAAVFVLIRGGERRLDGDNGDAAGFGETGVVEAAAPMPVPGAVDETGDPEGESVGCEDCVLMRGLIPGDLSGAGDVGDGENGDCAPTALLGIADVVPATAFPAPIVAVAEAGDGEDNDTAEEATLFVFTLTGAED
ncbi:hypothetical protein KEM56_007150 [Ascosphaera pollenicola]|nr:hypothetical protein KEM56_007150 [Ascosphaera pollenicola]